MRISGGRDARRTAFGSVVAVGLAVALLAGGCGTETAGRVQTEGNVGGLPVTHFESGLKSDAPKADLRVQNYSGTQEDELAVDSIADVSDFWSQQLPAHFGQEFKPVTNLLSYDPSDPPIEVCGSSTSEAAMNAFYCPPDDVVAWDRGQLLPLLHQRFGPMAIPTVLGHEFGHAIQYRLGEKAGVDDSTSTIVKEQQADCFAGAYFRWIAEDRSRFFQVSTSDGLNQVLTSMFYIRDQAGASASEQGAHGTAFDRTYAFQLGFEQNAKACAGIDQAGVDERITEEAFDDRDYGQGDLPVDEQNVQLLQGSLDAAFARVKGEKPTIVAGDGTCPGGVDTAPASYCEGDNTVNIDMEKLAEIGLPVDREAEYQGSESAGGLGDFAAFAEIVSRYAQGIQKGVGASTDGTNAGARTACLVGAWASASKSGDAGDLTLSSGDLDEAIAELLQPRSLVAADLDGSPVASGFGRVEALHTGYLDGSSACTKNYP